MHLAALDDSDFLDDLQRAQTRGMTSAPRVVRQAVDVLTGVVGMLAAAGTLGVLHPLLLPLLLLTAVPEGWASVRSARMQYLTMLALVEVARRKWILSDLMVEREHAAEVRSFTMRRFLLDQYDRQAAHQRGVELDLARRQTVARVSGDLLKGVATGGVYVALGLMLWQGAVPLAVAGTAVLAIRSGQSSLANLVFAVNQCYEEGLYFGDYLSFCEEAERRIPSRALSHAGGATAPLTDVVPILLQPVRQFLWAGSDDDDVNGDIPTVDRAWDAGFRLPNVAATLVLTCGGAEIDRVTYGPQWPGSIGVSMQLDPGQSTAAGNDAQSAWCAATTLYGGGNRGTPKSNNRVCTF